jgi:hypothetical protein
VHKTNSS